MNITNTVEGLKLVCKECNGTGKVNKQSSMTQKPNCPTCKGNGYIVIKFLGNANPKPL